MNAVTTTFGDAQYWARGIFPFPPVIPERPPAVIEQVFAQAELREFRMWGQPWVVEAHYDQVQHMLEDRIAALAEAEYQAWLQWVRRML